MAVRAYLRLRSLRKTAGLLGMGKSTLARWLRANPLIARRRAATKLTVRVMEDVRSFLGSHPFASRADVVAHIQRLQHVRLSESSVGAAIRRCGFSRKRTFARVERPDLPQLRSAFCRVAQHIPSSELVSLDETAFWLDMKPLYGYAPRGRRLSVRSSGRARSRWSLMLAVSDDRVVGHELRQGAYDGAAVASFVRGLQLQPGHKYLLMDNAAIHKTKAVAEAMRSVGVRPLFLSPYSPQYQPVEHVFSALKAHYRKTRPDDACATSAGESVALRVLACLEVVSPAALGSMFAACRARVRTDAAGGP